MNKDEIIHNDKRPIDIKTDYGKGFVPEIDHRTDAYDKQLPTMEALEQGNRMSFNSLITEEEQPKRHR